MRYVTTQRDLCLPIDLLSIYGQYISQEYWTLVVLMVYCLGKTYQGKAILKVFFC